MYTFYRPIQAQFDLSLTVGRGQIVCLPGGNTSGTSTTMQVIPGLIRPRSGTGTVDGRSLNGLSTPQISRPGPGAVPEARRLFGAMTVRGIMGAWAHILVTIGCHPPGL